MRRPSAAADRLVAGMLLAVEPFAAAVPAAVASFVAEPSAVAPSVVEPAVAGAAERPVVGMPWRPAVAVAG